MPQSNSVLKRNCPICISNSGTTIHNQRFVLEDNNPLPSEYNVVVCDKCNFMFADLESSQEKYDEFYSNMSKYENVEISSGSGTTTWDRTRLTQTADDVEKFCPQKSSSVLDIGAAQGGLVQILLNRGYCDLSVLEPSDACLKAINQASDGQIKTIQGNLSLELSELFPGKTFETIILSHVLEHIFDLNEAIKRIKTICSNDTHLYVEVPDAEYYSSYFKTPFHYFDIEHINHFDSHSLNLAFMKHGFTPIHTSRKVIEVSSSEFYPAIFSIFRINNITSSIYEYIRRSEDFDFSDVLGPLIASGVPIAVWGCGSFTKSLIAHSIFNKCNIIFLVDSDVKKIGSTVGPFKIYRPEILHNFEGTIVVSSAIYTDEIIDQIREMKLTNDFVKLK